VGEAPPPSLVWGKLESIQKFFALPPPSARNNRRGFPLLTHSSLARVPESDILLNLARRSFLPPPPPQLGRGSRRQGTSSQPELPNPTPIGKSAACGGRADCSGRKLSGRDHCSAKWGEEIRGCVLDGGGGILLIQALILSPPPPLCGVGDSGQDSQLFLKEMEVVKEEEEEEEQSLEVSAIHGVDEGRINGGGGGSGRSGRKTKARCRERYPCNKSFPPHS
jgi:hypothetical protein